MLFFFNVVDLIIYSMCERSQREWWNLTQLTIICSRLCSYIQARSIFQPKLWISLSISCFCSFCSPQQLCSMNTAPTIHDYRNGCCYNLFFHGGMSNFATKFQFLLAKKNCFAAIALQLEYWFLFYHKNWKKIGCSKIRWYWNIYFIFLGCIFSGPENNRNNEKRNFLLWV